MFRSWLLLVVVAIALLGLYYLPEQIGSWELKPVDMLSELRQDEGAEEGTPELDEPTSTKPIRQLTQGMSDTLQVELVAQRDSTYQQLLSQSTEADSTLTAIEDFSPTRTGLGRLFAALRGQGALGRPARIAVLGDSFIEGDIFTDALRSGMQSRFGGGGVGWMPITSEVAGFRASIKHQFGGWQDHSLLKSKDYECPMTGHYYTAGENAWVSYASPTAAPIASARMYYRASEDVELRIELADTTYTTLLPATTEVGAHELCIEPSPTIKCIVPVAKAGFRSYGIALEDQHGISIDNMSIRGNSGILLASIDHEVSKDFANLRTYDLIILQYGLNVASAKQSDYSAYTQQMAKVIDQLQSIAPTADLLLMSVSDRAQRSAGGIDTMPGVVALHSAQRKLAQQKGIAFWSALSAMRSLGGIAQMTAKGWAAKDYTHLSHRGGQQVAEKLLEAIDLEKKYYDAI